MRKTRKVHTLIAGSGAAGLNAALELHSAGVHDLLIVSAGLKTGTSINTGSDKQTYYKLGLYGSNQDSPQALATSLSASGSMHGDIALAEAAGSVRAFMNLVKLGVPFPHDRYGQYIGYRTDHDSVGRASSCGPYTSRIMCEKLIDEVKRRNIEVLEFRYIASLLTDSGRCVGITALDNDGNWEIYQTENVLFATGGPGGIYADSVYPIGHHGSIGLALEIGAMACNLSESQFGIASTKFRWNVSGSYMQVLPRIISTASDGSDEREFLVENFSDDKKRNELVFLKGYEWPFDVAKSENGSSRIDLLIYRERIERGRRVFLDFRANSACAEASAMPDIAYDYLKRSNALQSTPWERLQSMNPEAFSLYMEHGINLSREPLEIAVCAQHNNGGLAVNHWWESENIRGLFPVGEVAGTHGVTRPGGSALNSGQVGSARACEFIASGISKNEIEQDVFERVSNENLESIEKFLSLKTNSLTWSEERSELMKRMSRSGAFLRDFDELKNASAEAWKQWRRLETQGCIYEGRGEAHEALRTRSLCLTHCIYLDALISAIEYGTGSRGSGLVFKNGERVPENTAMRKKILYTRYHDKHVENNLIDCRMIPESDGWFEEVWQEYRQQKYLH